MKKIIFLLVLLVSVASFNLFATHTSSILKIKVHQSAPIQLFIDGHYMGIFQSNFEINNLAPGQHFMQLIRKGGRRYGGQVLFAGNVSLWTQYITIARFGNQFGVNIEQRPLMQQNNCNNQYNNNNAYENCAPTPTTISQLQFNQFLSVVQSSWFDSSKKELIVNFLQQHNLYASQVKALIKTLDFESTRVLVAKQAYAKTIDRANYFIVFDCFDFESSKIDLSNFMRSN
jgi:hypothetical protein